MARTRETPGEAQRGDRLVSPLVLASASPRRAEVLKSAGFSFEIVPSSVDEAVALTSGKPGSAAVALAAAKAQAVAAARRESIVLGADTVVVFEGEALGKPADAAGAAQMLRRLRGREHTVITGVAVAWRGLLRTGQQSTVVVFRSYSDHELDSYVSSGAPLDKAGAYGIQNRPFLPAAGYDGCYLNVVGLPLCLAGRLLQEVGAIRAGQTTPDCPGHRS